MIGSIINKFCNDYGLLYITTDQRSVDNTLTFLSKLKFISYLVVIFLIVYGGHKSQLNSKLILGFQFLLLFSSLIFPRTTLIALAADQSIEASANQFITSANPLEEPIHIDSDESNMSESDTESNEYIFSGDLSHITTREQATVLTEWNSDESDESGSDTEESNLAHLTIYKEGDTIEEFRSDQSSDNNFNIVNDNISEFEELRLSDSDSTEIEGDSESKVEKSKSN